MNEIGTRDRGLGTREESDVSKHSEKQQATLTNDNIPHSSFLIPHFLSFLIISLLFVSCFGKADTLNRPKGSIDALPVNRVISAAPSITEIIVGLEMADKLVAVDAYSRSVEGVRANLPEIDFFYPDAEAVAGLKPDLIIAGEVNYGGASDTPFDFFRRMGIQVLEIPTSNSIQDIFDDIITIAHALGVPEKGEALALFMQEQIATLSLSARSLADHSLMEYTTEGTAIQQSISVYFEIAPPPHIVSFGRGTYLNEMIALIGAKNIFADKERWFTPNAEAIILANPDIIFFLADTANKDKTESEAMIAEIKNRPGFNAINAVRQGRIYPINADSASRPSHNIVLALEEMAGYRE